MGNEISSQFQVGSIFPEISFSVLCLIKEGLISKIEISQIKTEIKEYLKIHKKAYISDLATALNVQPRKIVLAVKELKEEGFITETD